jgi:hypothetical protein
MISTLFRAGASLEAHGDILEGRQDLDVLHFQVDAFH